MENVAPIRGNREKLEVLYEEAWGLISEDARLRLTRLGVTEPFDLRYSHAEGPYTVRLFGKVRIEDYDDCCAFVEFLWMLVVVLKKNIREERERTPQQK